MLPLTYTYRPGRHDDGVTLEVGPAEAERLTPIALDWAVPGHLEQKVEHYLSWWRAQGRQDALKQLRADGAAAREAALEKAREQLEAGEDPAQVVQRLAHQLTNRLLHGPTTALRQAALDGDTDLLRAAERLFRGPDDSEPAA